MSSSESKLPLFAALFLILVGLLIGAIGGFGSGSIAGGIIAGLGIIPACYGMWLGVQDKESQATMMYSVLLFLGAVGVGGLLILLRFFDWLT